MKYGSTTFKIKSGSLSIVSGNRTEVREYPGKDTADFFDLGKMPTKIKFTVIAESESDKTLYESLFHTPVKRELTYDNGGYYYKDVIPDQDFKITPFTETYTGIYLIPIQLIALDPLPYNVDTDEVMY